LNIIILLSGYISNSDAEKAIEYFKQVKNPNHVIYLLLLNAYAQLRTSEALDLIKNISKTIPQSIYLNENFRISLIDALTKCGDIQAAQTVFYASKYKTVPMYNALIKGQLSFDFLYLLYKEICLFSGFVINNQINKANNVFKQMKKPDEMTYTIPFNAYAQLASNDALIYIKKTFEKRFHNHSIQINGLLQH